MNGIRLFQRLKKIMGDEEYESGSRVRFGLDADQRRIVVLGARVELKNERSCPLCFIVYRSVGTELC